MRTKPTTRLMALALMLTLCFFVSTGYADEFSDMETLANQGDADAQFELGVMYDNGDGVEQDSTKAAYWYEKAVEQGNMHAQFYLAHSYYHGTGVTQDQQKACNLLKAAAAQGHRAAHQIYNEYCE